MASVVDICNMALSFLGGNNIASLGEASTEAKACQQFYATCRDGLLAGYPWGFAQKQKALAQIVNDRPGIWTHAYQCPTDVLKILLVRPAWQNGIALDEGAQAHRLFPHHLAGGTIYCNVDGGVLIYTARIDDPALYPPLFVAALANGLASFMAMALTRSMEVQGRMLQLAQNSALAAQMADANQEGHFYDGGSGFVEARGCE